MTPHPFLLQNDELLKFRPYQSDDMVFSHFTRQETENIAAGIENDKEWADFLKKYVSYFMCIVPIRKSDNAPIGMAYLINEDLNWKKVSIHGGAWGGSPMLTYRAYIILIKSLLDQGIKVTTTCSISNSKAVRFNRSIGFVKYRSSDDTVWMWINTRRLESTSIYKRLFGNQSE